MEVTGLSGLLGSLGGETTPETRRNDELNRTDFLNLLVAQLQNQDPLNPLESADFTAQLATFSSLEQLMQINGKLGEETDPTGSSSSLDALGFLGQEVGFSSDELAVSDGLVPAFDLSLAGESQVTVEILDRAGQAVGSVDLGTLPGGRQSIDLGTAAGAPSLGDGTYTLKISATDASGAIQELSPVFRTRVDGVDLSGASPVLLAGDRRIDVTDVREIRSPAPAASEGA